MIRLDLNNREFQANLFALEKIEAWAVLKTLRLLQTIDWHQLHSSKGLHWELIQSRQGPQGQRAPLPQDQPQLQGRCLAGW